MYIRVGNIINTMGTLTYSTCHPSAGWLISIAFRIPCSTQSVLRHGLAVASRRQKNQASQCWYSTSHCVLCEPGHWRHHKSDYRSLLATPMFRAEHQERIWCYMKVFREERSIKSVLDVTWKCSQCRIKSVSNVTQPWVLSARRRELKSYWYGIWWNCTSELWWKASAVAHSVVVSLRPPPPKCANMRDIKQGQKP